MLFVFFSTCMHACYKSACQCYVVQFFFYLHACMLQICMSMLCCSFFFYLHACMLQTCMSMLCCSFFSTCMHACYTSACRCYVVRFFFYLHACMLQICMSMLCCSFFFFYLHACMLQICMSMLCCPFFFSTCMYACYKSACQC